MNIEEMRVDEADIEMIRRNQCPVCKNWGFIPGPRGGAGQNIYCANPSCRAAYMVSPRSNIVMVYRIGHGSENYYPPKVHIIAASGLPLCNFAGSITIDNGPPPRLAAVSPDAWPIGHDYVTTQHFEQSTCNACRQRARS